jgi:hypothetical protein
MRTTTITIALYAVLTTGCANVTATALVGTKVRDGGFYGQGPTATLRLEKHVSDRVVCEYEHVSHLLVGPPFGPASEEDSLNHVSCGVRFGL